MDFKQVAREMLAHHRRCSDEHFQRVKLMSLSVEEQCAIQKYVYTSLILILCMVLMDIPYSQSIKTSVLSSDVKVKLAMTMLKDLVDLDSFNFDQDCLLRFMLTVAKNYRNEDYHNWDHAFTVAHCMYWLLKGSSDRFSDLEVRLCCTMCI